MYGGDPFFTLTTGGRVGLIAVSLALSALALLAVWAATRGRRLPMRLAVAATAFLAFVWLSPQVYYLYFMTIFDGLPWQLVVKAPPSPGDLAALMTLQQRGTLANHGVALLGWSLAGVALRKR